MLINEEKYPSKIRRLIMVGIYSSTHVKRGGLLKDFAFLFKYRAIIVIIGDSCSTHFITNTFEAI
jgi:hypothetical protein